jgi:hypothetical protein
MKKVFQGMHLLAFSWYLLTLLCCNGKSNVPTNDAITAINLKRGEIISCGPPDQQFGLLEFETSCSPALKKDFNLAVSLLHSFEYDEAEKAFAKIIDAAPECALAYWGVAMSNYHPLWAPPTPPELEKGAKAIAIAQSITPKSKKESAYIDAIALFYKDWNKIDHRTRSIEFEKAMEKIYTNYPNDKEAAIFYALALDATADPADKLFKNQKKAGAILNAMYPGEPNHPGIVHYIIHTYDSPELAELGLSAARKYASVAPSSAHAQHMPSHIFTRLGLWDDCISSNLVAAASAKCYAENTGIKGHWDEELHAMDYLVYAYLQKGNNKLAKEQWDYLKTIKEVNPANFKVAYAFASIPSRYLLENKMWQAAASMEFQQGNFLWENYPWQKAIIHFTRLMGSVNSGNIDPAKAELKKLNSIYDTLVNQKDSYKANQVQIQIKTSEAWILFKEAYLSARLPARMNRSDGSHSGGDDLVRRGKNNEALQLMRNAATMEDNTQKHSVTPGEVLPARELLADMLLQMNKPVEALEEYEADLKGHSNRFNGLYGAGIAAEKSNNSVKANYYYKKLVEIANTNNSTRPELEAARLFLKKQKP